MRAARPRFRLVLTLLLLVPPLASAQESTEEIDSLLARGVTLYRSGDLIGAVDAYEAVLRRDPSRVDARSNLGAALARLGRYEGAVEEYKKALSAEPGNVPVRLNLALAYYKAARQAEAADELRSVLAAEPANKNALLLLADCQLQLGNDADVIALLSPHETAFGDDRLFAYLLGNALIRRNEIQRGQTWIDRLFRDGDTAEARLLMGAAHLRGADPKKALVELERALEINPRLPTVHAVHGQVLLRLGRKPEAALAFRRELEQNPNDFDSNLYLGLLKRDENQVDEAFAYLTRAGRLRPQDPRVLYGLGAVHLAADRIAQAQEALEAVVKAVPDYQQAHVLLATVYYRQKKTDLAGRERAIIEKLRAERQAREPGAQEGLGPAYQGDPLPGDPPAGGGQR